ncbi:Catalyzes the catabolism of the allantoin degradation intermediate (S)-ureidoglycolate [Vibrio sp. B1REV9]|uniref:ureidoglycolate lyase n=1 Tax=Vibrio TaxID=662 RepID=UPI001AF46D91|nr:MULTISPECIES: ureidoglycolate lyase [Vibrio]WQE75609.1 ureidoglycolate lyase [Vibrio alfacsensis]BBM63962.1 ureidoglycolate lyase [Vibrio alfacsensis]CAE6895350.1 Catalyzes the catabolism of the allantoin degradation intermediate (S)-ureidoglycolate [Vibrio sp. B1REV9]
MKTLELEPLTKSGFEPFGEVIETEESDFFFINSESGQRFHGLGEVSVEDDTNPLISIVRAKGVSSSIKIDLLEKHPIGSQAFFPLNGERFIVVVAEGGDEIDESTIKAFVSNGKQGVNYRQNAWHYLLFAWNKDTDFLTVDRAGEDNCIVRHLSEEFIIQL